MGNPRKIWVTAITALLALGTTAAAQETNLDDTTLFGINRQTGQLWRYDFADQNLAPIAKVRKSDGEILLGIDASAYFVDFQQIHAFWTDPNDNQIKMLHVDTETANAALDVVNLGTGTVHGAVSWTTDLAAPAEGEPQLKKWEIFALVKSGSAAGVAGGIYLNPSNDEGAQFTLKYMDAEGEEQTITRNDLHKNSDVNEDGVYWEGYCHYLRIQPHGNGDQNSLMINGEAYMVDNEEVYVIETPVEDAMFIRVQNDSLKNGKAMGLWWSDITLTTGTFQVGDAAPTPVAPTLSSKLMSIDTQTRELNTMMDLTLTRTYDGLATTDGATFYATSGNELYQLSPAGGTESLMGTMPHNQVLGLEFKDDALFGFELVNNKLAPINPSNGTSAGVPYNVSMTDLGTITFMPTEMAPAKPRVAFD
ncbi:MAG: hypothetical protein OER86_06725 [Phycisphaerae bacterium]|nr:hypothetical protein [Phycisphaerae bacterium]